MSREKPTTLREAGPGLRRTATHLRPYLRRETPLVAGGMLALFVEVLMRLAEPWPLKVVIDTVIAASGTDVAGAAPGDVRATLTIAAVALLGVVLVRAVAAYLTTLAFALAGNRLLTRVRADAYAHLQRLPMAFHDTARTGDLVQRVTGDVGRLKEVVVTAGLPLVGNIVTMLGMVVVVAFLDWPLALLMVAVVPLFLLAGRETSRSIHGVSKEQRKAEGELASLATETLSSMRVVHSYGLADHLQGRFAQSNGRSLAEGVRTKRLSARLERSTDVLVGLATALVLYVGAQRVLAGMLTPGELVVFLTYLKATFKPMRDLAKYTGRIAAAAASGERVVDLLEVEPTVRDHPAARTAPALRGELVLDDVWVSYTPDAPVLRGVSLRVAAGERVALVGTSGSGKSTLASLLSRLRDPDAGAVRVDGHDLRDLTLESLRSQVSVVLQESVLFATSIEENIAHGRPGATREEIEEAARIAGAHDFVEALPHGYATVVGERGATLSGGQRQRIAIARAAVRRAPVVVLDEALTGLDEGTEAEVLAALERLTAGRTTIVVTHDLAHARDCDRVVWLEGGEVVADGPPAAVLTPGAARAVG
ncbi:ATP-binding cassette subfamily B protein [Nocardioides zeae]|uniref:ATP-binding cassette subfamily B protein n=1 Tax=Nocardioides zeae TaxID=1457234 RepID=A0ACC6IL33_9ACTN|nr:ABC transporter ATP-binding protein [Nocardioides zeae]MDR6173968.1 ATP-binding cassette subfamily B protein [Nocardioides zeae]MDR6211476.1 ATP-binding cassette subfamily B protein [Nocardioides zeae]